MFCIQHILKEDSQNTNNSTEVFRLAKGRHMYPGGNTCYGFYSFYDHIVPHDARNKIVLKGGPGVGKSTFMKMVGEELQGKGIAVEYHWCSSDNNSLDGVVAGDREVCLVDGTAPHVVDPRYPGAVDRIVNLGDFWDGEKIFVNKESIIKLTTQIGQCFNRAYNRLHESQLASREWISYHREAVNSTAVNRNIIALADDFLQQSKKTDCSPRHLFAAALTPNGIESKVDSLISTSFDLFAVKGNPGSGVKDLFQHIESMVKLTGIYAEIYHCPFDPAHIDMIIIPGTKNAIIDISGYIVDYESQLPSRKYKRFLDFDSFLDSSIINVYSEQCVSAKERLQEGLSDAINFIKTAKTYHDELETFYVPAMNFAGIDELRKEIVAELVDSLN